MPAYDDAGRGASDDIFSCWQPTYAAHRIATFPVKIVDGDKVPAVKHYDRIGLRASNKLVAGGRFHYATMLGFMCSQRNGIAILDCDTTDENVLSDALTRHGTTPLIVRTASGKFHAYYKHNGERRRIRPWRDQGLPIDVLGGGAAVAAPSRIGSGTYQIIQGSLDDLDRLPVMRGLDPTCYARNKLRNNPPRSAEKSRSGIGSNEPNDSLWRHCMRQAKHSPDLDTLIALAKTSYDMPVNDDELRSTARKAWTYTVEGRNYVDQIGGARLSPAECEALFTAMDSDALYLLAYLRHHEGPNATFMIANGMAEDWAWRRHRFAAARQRLLDLGYIREVRPASSGYGPAQHRWK
jgi:hypothetical protein